MINLKDYDIVNGIATPKEKDSKQKDAFVARAKVISGKDYNAKGDKKNVKKD